MAITIQERVSHESGRSGDLQAVEYVLARLIARRFLYSRNPRDTYSIPGGSSPLGPSAAAAAVAGAPPASVGGPPTLGDLERGANITSNLWPSSRT